MTTPAILPEPDPVVLKKLRLLIDADDPVYPGWKKLKVRGKELNDLRPEVFWLDELEVMYNVPSLRCLCTVFNVRAEI